METQKSEKQERFTLKSQFKRLTNSCSKKSPGSFLSRSFLCMCSISQSVILLTAGIFLFSLTGCSSYRIGSRDGVPMIHSGVRHVSSAVTEAASSPSFWIPATAAGLIYLFNGDKTISDWASSTNPIFGSPDRAGRASDRFLEAAQISAKSAVILKYTLGNSDLRVLPVITGVGAGLGAVEANRMITRHMKRKTDRIRPDKSDDYSFPSGHTSTASVHAAVGAQMVRRMDIAPVAKTLSTVGFSLLTAATAWARVEARKHYPSDVLFGASLGNFCATLLTNLLIPQTPLPLNALNVHFSPERVNLTITVPIKNP
ncbi:MAG: phosphatase PAP2 family protein [Chitinivibrionales bacterium]|nr:phosphatase PAP2 family protein [Chitinivibrionales bacterium]